MIEPKFIKQLTTRYQTTIDNVVREYFQHLFLSFFYREKNSEHILFKGGTALRLIWKSPRFSEDLDFSAFNVLPIHIETLIENVLTNIEKEGIDITIEEAKKTTGGYLAIFHYESGSYKSSTQIEISLRTKVKSSGTTALIQSDFMPPYNLMHLYEESLISEKIQACLTRAKERDFFDLYFILRSSMNFKNIFLKNKSLKDELLSKIDEQDFNTLKNELRRFLPSSHHLILKDLKSNLVSELKRNFPTLK